MKIQINIWRNKFYRERVNVYMCRFLTYSILIDEVNNYTGVILRTACFDLNCPLFTCLDFWHRLSSIVMLTWKSIIRYILVFIQWITYKYCKSWKFVCEWLNYVIDDVTFFFFSLYFPTCYYMFVLLIAFTYFQPWICVNDTFLNEVNRKVQGVPQSQTAANRRH